MLHKHEKTVKNLAFVGFFITAIIIIVALLGFQNEKMPSVVAELPAVDVEQPAVDTEPSGALTESLSEQPTEEPEPTPIPTLDPTATPTEVPTPTEEPIAGPFGPDPEDFPAGMSMLTGQMVADPATLNYPPAMVSITNWPSDGTAAARIRRCISGL